MSSFYFYFVSQASLCPFNCLRHVSATVLTLLRYQGLVIGTYRLRPSTAHVELFLPFIRRAWWTNATSSGSAHLMVEFWAS